MRAGSTELGEGLQELLSALGNWYISLKLAPHSHPIMHFLAHQRKQLLPTKGVRLGTSSTAVPHCVYQATTTAIAFVKSKALAYLPKSTGMETGGQDFLSENMMYANCPLLML